MPSTGLLPLPGSAPRAKALPVPWGTQTSPAQCGGSHTTIATSLKPCEGTPVSPLAWMLLHPPPSLHCPAPDIGASPTWVHGHQEKRRDTTCANASRLQRASIQARHGCTVTRKREETPLVPTHPVSRQHRYMPLKPLKPQLLLFEVLVLL